MRYLSFLVLLITLTACRGQLVEKIDTSVVSETILVYGVELKYEKGMDLADSILYYDDTIEKIRLDFTVQKIYEDLWSTRMMLVDTVEGLLTRINNNPHIIHQLHHYPFTADDLEVYICYTSFYGKYVDLQDSALATLRFGNASYFTFTAPDCSQDCWQQRREYYWQSKMFVDYYREGLAEFGPKPIEFPSEFGAERFIPRSK